MVDVAAGTAGGGVEMSGIAKAEMPISPEAVIAAYSKLGAVYRVANELRIPERKIRQILDEAGVERRKSPCGCKLQDGTIKDKVIAAYNKYGVVARVSSELHISHYRVSEMLKDAGVLERKPKSTDRSKQSYNDIDRDLHLAPGVKVATPKGIRIIFKVYPYHIATKTRYGNIECFTKSSLLCCATLRAAGLDYRDKEDEE